MDADKASHMPITRNALPGHTAASTAAGRQQQLRLPAYQPCDSVIHKKAIHQLPSKCVTGGLNCNWLLKHSVASRSNHAGAMSKPNAASQLRHMTGRTLAICALPLQCISPPSTCTLLPADT